MRVGGDYDFADWISLMVPESASGLFKPYRRYAVTTVISGDGDRSIDFNSDSMYFEGTAKISTSLFSQTLFISDEMLSFLIFKFTELR